MKVAYSCVVDAKPKFEWQAFLWAQSLMKNGKCQPYDLKIHCMPCVSEHFRDYCRKLNIHIIDAKPFEGGHAYCNKIQQCFSKVFGEYEKIILMDADMFLLAPPKFPTATLFAGKIVDTANPPLEILRSLYQDAHIQPSKTVPVNCALSPQEKTFRNNLNGGLYVIDTALLGDIGLNWKKNALWVIDRIDRLGRYHPHIDQIAMSLTLDQLEIDVSLLTEQANFPVHMPKERLRSLSASQIDVLHYHSSVLPNGQIRATGVPAVDAAIARANNDIASMISTNFNNALFWNNRYTSFPEIGSGVGSRGETLEYKKALLQEAVKYFEDKTVLEIGCGDLETSKDLKFKAYVGNDVSATALEIAKKKRPDWRFVHGTIETIGERVKADLVMCIDVLIHQKNGKEYHNLVSGLVKATKQRLIVSGYEMKPSLVSNIVAYHEPLSTTLKRFGVFNEIMCIGKYRDVFLVVADKGLTGLELHRNDIRPDVLVTLLPFAECPNLLRAIMDASRKHFGFFTQTSTRVIEYPWIMKNLRGIDTGSRILDIGSGISPLPILLAEQRLFVECVDSHHNIRSLSTKDHLNEWGFLDYSVISQNISSFNVDIVTFQPNNKFEAIYSVSVIEHMPRIIWERTLDLSALWLNPRGLLLLTLDIIPGTEDLWNMSEGKQVDNDGFHGSLSDILSKLTRLNFEIEDLFLRRKIPYSRTDVAFLRCRLKTQD
jgi:2-polyprenyl-3-methyl-5-hydroxy-6-metoxy-1,4-benzoquinol methylase